MTARNTNDIGVMREPMCSVIMINCMYASMLVAESFNEVQASVADLLVVNDSDYNDR